MLVFLILAETLQPAGAAQSCHPHIFGGANKECVKFKRIKIKDKSKKFFIIFYCFLPSAYCFLFIFLSNL